MKKYYSQQLKVECCSIYYFFLALKFNLFPLKMLQVIQFPQLRHFFLLLESERFIGCSLNLQLHRFILKINRHYKSLHLNHVKYTLSRRRSGVFINNFEHILHLFLVSIVEFEQVNASWELIAGISQRRIQNA